MGLSWGEFLSRYTKTLLNTQKSYGVDNPTIRFNLDDMEKFLSKTTSKTPNKEKTFWFL